MTFYSVVDSNGYVTKPRISEDPSLIILSEGERLIEDNLPTDFDYVTHFLVRKEPIAPDDNCVKYDFIPKEDGAEVLNDLLVSRIRDSGGFEYSGKRPTVSYNMGVVGNVWLRLHHIPKMGGHYQGHKHYHDHVSMLVSGKVRVEVDGFEPTEFEAPTFIVVKAEHNHRFVPLTDNVLWYCVFALRDEDGGVSHYSEENSPYVKPLKPIEQ